MKKITLFLVVAWGLTFGNAFCFAQTGSDEQNLFLQLWTSDAPFPTKGEVDFPEGVQHSVVQDGNLDDEYEFMHETALGFCGDELIYGWYNNPEKELQGKTIQRARRSYDLGETWTEPEIVMDPGTDKNVMFVGLQFFSADNSLWLLTNMESEAERPVHTLLAKYDPAAKKWNTIGPVAERFLAMQAPVMNDEGNYVVSGSYAVHPDQQFASTPAVYVSQGKDIEKPWRLERLDPNEKVNFFAETGVILDKNFALAVTRREDSPFPNFYASNDFGKNWTSVENKTFPAVHSKFAAGTFSNGIRYIVFNLPCFKRLENGSIDVGSIEFSSRDSLVIAIARPGEKAFSHMYTISDPSASTRLSTSHYPCVVEHDGWIYVSYTGTFVDKPLRVGALAKFPLKSLE